MALPNITTNPVRYGKVSWVGIVGLLDSYLDLDDNPDEASVEGIIIFKPSVNAILYPLATPKYTRLLVNRQVNITDGAITEQGRKYIKLEANVAGANPAIVTWTATFVLSYNGIVIRLPDAKFALTPDSTIDLTDYIDPGSGATGYPGVTLTDIQQILNNFLASNSGYDGGVDE